MAGQRNRDRQWLFSCVCLFQFFCRDGKLENPKKERKRPKNGENKQLAQKICKWAKIDEISFAGAASVLLNSCGKRRKIRAGSRRRLLLSRCRQTWVPITIWPNPLQSQPRWERRARLSE